MREPSRPHEQSPGPPTARTNDPRDRAFDHLLTLVDRFPDLPIDAPSPDGLTARDAALLRAIDGAVRRRWLTLRSVASSFLNRPFESLDAPAQVGLLAGAAQLLLLDRIPDHAAIDSAVGWTKRTQGKGVAGLVNAVLRNIARRRDDASVRRLAEPSLEDREFPLPDGRVLGGMLPARGGADRTAERLAGQCSLALPLVAAWIANTGAAEATRRALCSIVPAPTIVRCAPGAAMPTGLVTHDRPGFAVYDAEAGPLSALIDQSRGCWVQDPGSAEALDPTADLNPALIVDLCAGRGTKTRQLAAMHPAARIVASDPDAARLAVLRGVFQNDRRVTVTTDDAVDRLGQGADLVVVDVPCSNTGVLSRRLEARYRYADNRQRELVALQRRIVERALRIVGRNGHVLYATCSLEPEENVHPWSELARRTGHADIEILRVQERSPAGLPGEPSGRHLDGGGATLLQTKPVE